MRYEGTRPSGRDKDIPVFIFAMGKEELKLLMACVDKAIKYTPQVLETMIMHSRLRNIRKNLNGPFIQRK